MAPVKLSKIPKHIWLGVVLPIVLVGLGIWRLWPVFVEYRAEDERMARQTLVMVTAVTSISDQPTDFLITEHVSELPPKEYLMLIHGYHFHGFCAWPKRYDWRHKHTFIINERATIYAVDNGGKLITEWPTDEELSERFTRMKRE